MHRKHLFAVTTLAALLAGVAQAEVERIQEVDVTADLTAVQNPAAAAYWSTLDTDLEAAIIARLTDRLGDEGARVLVDIREIELASAFERAVNLGDAVLVGEVNIVDPTNNANFNAYELSVSLGTTRFVVPEGQTVILSADDRASYQALIDTFADGVVERLN